MIARTLARRVAIRTTDREAFEAVRFLECKPEIAGTVAVDVVLTVERLRHRYCIIEEGADATDIVGLNALVDRLHSRLFSLSVQDRPLASIIHGALLRRANRRVLIAGAQGAGKTTLALRLAQAGYEFEGDEHVFLEEDGVIARPRACRVKEGSLALLPELAQIISSAPVYVDEWGHRTFNVDPTLIDGSWRIEKGRADAVIVLQPNHGGYSSLRGKSPMAVAQILIHEMGMRERGRGASIGAVAGLVSQTQGFDLSLGDPDGAIICVERALAG